MWLSAALAAGLTVVSAGPVGAAGTPDAQVTTTASGDPTMSSFQAMGQTFKAQHTGQLSEVDLHYGNNWWATGQKVQVWSVASGKPAVLASSVTVTSRFPFTADWHPFPLTTKVPVQAGQVYAIVGTSSVIGSIRWSYNTAAGYTDGQMLAWSGGVWVPFGLASGAAFLFKTFVDTAAAGLQVGSDAPAATAPEGTAPTMTGTYSGNVGSVTVSADHGKVAVGASAGTWTWSGDLDDEDNAPASIIITATDAAGASASTTFSLKITGVKPKASIAGSMSSPEGGTVTLHGSATAPQASDQATGFAFTWSVTKDGAAFSSGTGADYSFPTTDEGTYVVNLTAKDDGGMVSDPTSVTVVATEIQPTASITSISPADPALTVITPQETLSFAGSYRDPAPESHSFRWDFGDGASSTSLFASHAYAAAGTYPVTLTVTDDEGVAGTATASVIVQTTQQSLDSMVKYVQGLTSLNAGQQNSLIAKLNAASDASARGDNQAAHNELNAFVNELAADLKANKISAAAFNALRADAHAIQSAIGTYNRFVDWWPLAA